MLQFLMTYLNAYLRTDEEGQTLTEYALLLVLIAIVVITAVTLLGNNIDAIFNSIAGTLGVIPE